MANEGSACNDGQSPQWEYTGAGIQRKRKKCSRQYTRMYTQILVGGEGGGSWTPKRNKSINGQTEQKWVGLEGISQTPKWTHVTPVSVHFGASDNICL